MAISGHNDQHSVNPQVEGSSGVAAGIISSRPLSRGFFIQTLPSRPVPRQLQHSWRKLLSDHHTSDSKQPINRPFWSHLYWSHSSRVDEPTRRTGPVGSRCSDFNLLRRTHIDSKHPLQDTAMKGPLVVHIGQFCDDGSIRDELKRRHPSDDSDYPNQTPKRYKRTVKKSLLAEETWLRIQGLLSSTSSLSDTTRITLSFFKEHELIWAQEKNMQGASILPIAVPASEVYGMLVPRKRRLYDVLHVLEGMGVIKRSRGQLASSPRQRGAHFVYYGRAGVLKRLEFIKRRVDDIKHSCVGHDESEFQRAVDEAIVQACETQSVIEHWPHLSSTTVVLLSMLLCSDDTSENIAISDICHRLAEVRYDLEDPANYKAAIADVNRRVYDVASVLASCNLVLLSASPLLPHIVRKGVRFNHGVFTSSDLIRMGEACSCYASHWHERTCFPGRRKTDDQVAETWESPAGSEMANFGATLSSPTLPTVYSDGKLGNLFPSPNCWSDSAITMDEWWSTSVRDLVLRDALPDADFLDWEIMQALARERKYASKQSDVSCSADFSPGQIDEYSLICDEVLADDDSDVGIDSQC